MKDLTWFALDGTEMTDEQWRAPGVRTLAVQYAGDAIDDRSPRGERIRDDTLLVILNADERPVAFTLPNHDVAQRWEVVFDTVHPTFTAAHAEHDGGAAYRVAPSAPSSACAVSRGPAHQRWVRAPRPSFPTRTSTPTASAARSIPTRDGCPRGHGPRAGCRGARRRPRRGGAARRRALMSGEVTLEDRSTLGRVSRCLATSGSATTASPATTAEMRC